MNWEVSASNSKFRSSGPRLNGETGFTNDDYEADQRPVVDCVYTRCTKPEAGIRIKQVLQFWRSL
jgi:hypothetical protein